MTAAVSTTTQEILRVSLPAELVLHFEALAVINGHSVEEEIVAHLSRTKAFTGSAPMYFNDAESGELRKLLGMAVTSPGKVIDMIRRILSSRVGKYKIEMSPARQDAIYWWIRNSGMPEAQALAMFWDQALGLVLKC